MSMTVLEGIDGKPYGSPNLIVKLLAKCCSRTYQEVLK